MSKALIAGINQVAVDKGLDREVIFEAIEAALISAYKRNYGSVANVSAEVDRSSGEMRVFAEREVVEDVINIRTEITEQDAKRWVPTVTLGDVIKVETKPDDFGRIAAQTAKQVILQRIREAERDTLYENFAHRVGEIISAQVRSIDTVSGAATILLDEKHETLMMRDDQIRTERLRRGDYVKVYVVDVHRSTRGPVIKISRTHRNLLRRLMEQEIPEIRDGIVEIKAIAREPGARSKAAVVATVPGIDPVGSCVGMRGLRIQNIVNELSGEKIDVVEWSNDVIRYISNALSPAKVTNVLLDDSGSIKTAVVVVPDRQLSLAIGKEGQNARLAAKLTGWRIDIKSESESIAEGLDKLIAEQATTATITSGENDLLAYAEELLRNQDTKQVGTDSDDLLRQAAKRVEEMPSTPVEMAEESGRELPSLEELDSLTKAENTAPKLSFDDAAAMVEKEEQEFVEQFPVYDINFEEEFSSEENDDQGTSGPEKSDGTKKDEPEESSDIITADMLRSRSKKKQEIDFDSPDFEIPAELLVGLDPDDTEEQSTESEIGKGKGKKKSAKGEKKSRRRKRQADTEKDEFSDFF